MSETEYRLLLVDALRWLLSAPILSVSWQSCVRKRWRPEHSTQWCLVTGRTAALALYSWPRPSSLRPDNLLSSSFCTVLTYVQHFCVLVLCRVFHRLGKMSIFEVCVNCSSFKYIENVNGGQTGLVTGTIAPCSALINMLVG